MKKSIRYNLLLILFLIITAILSAIMNNCVERYHSFVFPEKTDMASGKIEPSWDRTLAERIVKLFIPKWQEEILDQERIVRLHGDAPDKVINAYLKIAELYEKNEKYDKAEENCNRILKDYPASPLRKNAYLRLASIYEKEKIFKKVREINEAVIQEFPDDSEVAMAELKNIETYEKEENLHDAISGYLKFLERYPKTKERDYLNFKIGLLYRKLGQDDKANEFYNGITWDKDNVWSKNARAEIWLSTGKGEPKKKVIYAIKVTTPPKIDGYLTDSVWEKADTVTGFVDYQKDTPVSQVTFASLVYDENNLYAAFNCMESNISGLLAKSTTRDKDVWSDDCVEVFVDTNRDYSTYFQLIVNPIGTKHDGDKSEGSDYGTTWDPRWQAATAIGEKHWNVELAISFKELKTSTPKSGDVWGLNLTRARRAGELEISNWSFTGGNHHTPEKFGYLKFLSP